MNINQLKYFASINEFRIDNHKNFKRTPPYYFDSLRHAFESFFKTFQTNSTYIDYVDDFQSVSNLKYNDDENIVKTIIFFERFFELYYKDILRRVDKNLVLQRNKQERKIENLVSEIEYKVFKPKKHKTEKLRCSFRVILNRFYQLIKLTEHEKPHSPLVKKFNKLLGKYHFLDNEQHESTMFLLSWLRDKILHNGSLVLNLWFLDYFVTQRVVPLIYKIRQVEKERIRESLFYLQTETGIDILQKLHKTKLKLNYGENEIKLIKLELLKIGHLKEIGRGSLNRHLYARESNHSDYEYNYHDVKGRGIRFAKAEQKHKHFKQINECICCGVKSLVKYSFTSLFLNNPILIAWVKCYTCDYYLKNDSADPYQFNLCQSPLFDDKT